MIGHIPYGCGLLEAADIAPERDSHALQITEAATGMVLYTTEDKNDARRFIGMLNALRNGYDRQRIPDAPAEPLDCARRRGEHFVERMRAHRSACAKERMGWDGRYLVPEMPT